MSQSEIDTIGAPYTFPCGLVAPNRLCKVNNPLFFIYFNQFNFDDTDVALDYS